ncbi:MAG: acyl-CoA dehydrogenase family protein [Hyphomonas sp.]
MARAGAPPLSPMGTGMCGPALIGHGSKVQKDRYLPRSLAGEDFWCKGY